VAAVGEELGSLAEPMDIQGYFSSIQDVAWQIK
jgi:hypothetical protein